MSNKLSLSVILPIKSSKAKNFDEYFKNAIDSIKNQQVELEELLIVHTSEESLIELLNSYDFGNLTVTKLFCLDIFLSRFSLLNLILDSSALRCLERIRFIFLLFLKDT